MIFNINMFESEKPYAVVLGKGYESILTHKHEFIEITYVESGSAMHKLGSDIVNLKKGDIFVIADDREHSIRPTCEENEFRIINLIFLRNFADFDFKVFNPLIPINVAHNREITDHIELAKNSYETRGKYVDETIKGCIYVIMSKLGELYASDGAKTTKNYKVAYVSSAVDYITENFNKKISLEDVASYVGITSGYLQRIFHKERKTSVIEFLLRYRIEQSCKLLIETEKTIAAISEEVGFSDIKNYHYVFKRVFGITPNIYRQTHRNKFVTAMEERCRIQ
ncbi:MAG: helix-turn-helix domain-containing protein [Clostridia bacterium]|nr:helix-turn-helix domain-containing protein [Clostridia bacterium]